AAFVARPGRPRVLGRAGVGWSAAGALGLVLPTGFRGGAWVLAPPVLALTMLGAGRERSGDPVEPQLVALGAGFVVVAAICYVPSLRVLGPERFARGVLLVGAGVAGLYVLPFPSPGARAGAVGVVGRARRGGRPLLALAVLATLVVAVLVGAAGAAGLRMALRRGAEEGALALVPLILWGALAVYHRRREAMLLAPTAIAV